MRQLWSIKRSLTTTALQALVQAFVHCRLDYCNALLAGVADVHLKCLQSVQNAAAWLVSGSRSCEASPRTSVLVASSSTNRLQDGSTSAESSAQCSSSVFVGILCSSGYGVRSTAPTVGDCWNPDVPEGSDDNRPAELCRQWADCLEQVTSCSASTWQIIGEVQASS